MPLEKMKTVRKTIIALLAATVMPAIAFFGISLLLSIFNNVYFDIGLEFLFTKFALVIASVHIFILGIPALLLGQRLGIIRWWSTLSVAFIIGALPTTILFWHDRSAVYAFAPIMGFFGVVGGLAFWIVWRYWVRADLLTEE